MLPTWISDLAAKWREQADAYEADGFVGHAVLRRVADELEVRACEHEIELLTIDQASSESGFSYSHLQRLVSEGDVPNAGEPGAPRIRRADLPRKAGRRPTLRAEPGGIADEILARGAR